MTLFNVHYEDENGERFSIETDAADPDKARWNVTKSFQDKGKKIYINKVKRVREII